MRSPLAFQTAQVYLTATFQVQWIWLNLAKYSLNKAQIKIFSNMPSAFIQAGGRSVFVKIPIN